MFAVVADRVIYIRARTEASPPAQLKHDNIANV